MEEKRPDYLERAHGYELHPLLKRLQATGKDVRELGPFIRGIALTSKEESEILGKSITLLEFSRVGGQFLTIVEPQTFEFYTEATVRKDDKEKRFSVGDILVLNQGGAIEIVREGGPVVVLANSLLEQPQKKGKERVKLEEL